MEKVNLSTTIRKNTMEGFKELCKSSNVAMNVVLEAFMEQCIKGEIKISNAVKFERV